MQLENCKMQLGNLILHLTYCAIFRNFRMLQYSKYSIVYNLDKQTNKSDQVKQQQQQVYWIERGFQFEFSLVVMFFKF